MDSDTTTFLESLNGIANCARSLVRLCVVDPVRFHRHMAHEICLTLFEPVPGCPSQVINTLFRSTGEFDLHVEMSASVEGPEPMTVYFDASKLAWCNSRVFSTASTVSVDGSRVGMSEVPAWIVDQDEAAHWASGAGVAPGDSAGAVREIEAAALDAWEHLAQLVRYASATEPLSDEGEGCRNAVR